MKSWRVGACVYGCVGACVRLSVCVRVSVYVSVLGGTGRAADL